jgi:hypothetical protein
MRGLHFTGLCRGVQIYGGVDQADGQSASKCGGWRLNEVDEVQVWCKG